ncbi:MAG: hypothetical protein QE277_10285 [Flectobacillus sp.]|nr:hypothetical protein [Flectobacillus sp.]
MKKLGLLSLLWLVTFCGQAQEYRIDMYSRQQGYDSVRAFLKTFANDIQQLGNKPDSVLIPKIQQNILKRYFANDEVLIPNILEEDAIYRQKRPTISAKKWIEALPNAFRWGYQYVIEDSLVKIIGVKNLSKTETEVTCLIPLKFWAVKVNQRNLHRIGEYLVVKLGAKGFSNGKSLNFFIKEMGFTGKWIFGEPLTKNIVESIHNKVVNGLNTLLDNTKTVAEQAMICQELRNTIKGDTIFFYTGDKVLKAFSINECSKVKTLDSLLNGVSKITISSFDLSYVTDFYLEPNGQYIGERSKLTNVTLNVSNSAPWFASKKIDLVVVPNELTKNQLSYWQLSNVVIQPLMIKK